MSSLMFLRGAYASAAGQAARIDGKTIGGMA
jgi:hypothetical protein